MRNTITNNNKIAKNSTNRQKKPKAIIMAAAAPAAAPGEIPASARKVSEEKISVICFDRAWTSRPSQDTIAVRSSSTPAVRLTRIGRVTIDAAVATTDPPAARRTPDRPRAWIALFASCQNARRMVIGIATAKVRAVHR